MRPLKETVTARVLRTYVPRKESVPLARLKTPVEPTTLAVPENATSCAPGPLAQACAR
jgi:hypothetical protein